MNCFRVDYPGRGELADRQQKLGQFLSRLVHMAEGQQDYVSVIKFKLIWLIEFNVCVLMVRL